MNDLRLVPLLGIALLSALPACSSAPPPGPALPGFEGLERDVRGGGEATTPTLPSGGPGISPRSSEAALLRAACASPAAAAHEGEAALLEKEMFWRWR
ncbi:MAG: hypothetical protein ACPGQD_07430, partial [Planctomycetota bacterium]